MLPRRDEEKTLVRRLQAAVDPERKVLFEDLYPRYDRYVRTFVAVRVDNQDHAQEIAQETWLRFWETLASYNPDKSPLIAWLRLLALHALADYFARHNRSSEFECVVAEICELDDEPYTGKRPNRHNLTDLVLFNRVLELILDSGGPPHELIVYCFWQLLEWKPAEFDEKESQSILNAWESRFEHDYGAVATLLSSAQIARICAPLRARLKKALAALDLDPAVRVRYERVFTRQTGLTPLQDYYRDDHKPASEIQRWTENVQRRLIPLMRNAGLASEASIGGRS